jgi:hypothetical protein
MAYQLSVCVGVDPFKVLKYFLNLKSVEGEADT